ncbi:MAG: LysR family transcriptional regulator [Lawsonibacter sp.]
MIEYLQRNGTEAPGTEGGGRSGFWRETREFSHLKYFLMVAEELNITRAAERLYISQQSLG